MKKQDFYFDLPEELIAQYPLANRSDSRLLVYNRKQKNEYGHHQFRDIADFLNPGDLLVMNNTRVIPARLYGQKPSGGKVELLVERVTSPTTFLAHIKASKALKAGGIIQLAQGLQLEVLERQDDLFHCQSTIEVLDLVGALGHMPLPPYITRDDEIEDKERYQTVYAKYEGSVAAPTAGLHFDEAVIEKIKAKGIKIAYVTLHVGAGTFRPVRSDDIKDHKMHSEQYTVTAELCTAVEATKAAGNRVIAIGTTALRSLESAAANGVLKPCSQDTNIFIYPGYEFKICDGLMTNFHLPESTLLMLVSAFIGHKEAMALYQEAIDKKYRFFSYGDTSLLV
ncbi:tRNA preQ1(34) S-adenosylmethionine ribosyltransferase-isomerase QueA [Legionella sp. km772]|uniref:tRNA preQ1(34) S-adenosylmethionine ribosyltransferase-isomerase QueA n=1 Tax=Legionella sp. km772 TaxID=2498111 RepID=UPI000F8DDA7C|nr:tRNA preQ1(34) S-adenosylmethionine ribosyltransferase-isomerase QueA [Legionella sp. km772]RUR08504.1 tRNA preQ1(34) S-adenosylmethionine ribosyltransferase-isomerase QueA [Legionella sp. km772]